MTNDSSRADALTVALGEYDTGWHDPDKSLRNARELAESARNAGADLLVLPEMCTTGFTMDAAQFSESDDGPSVRGLADIASDNDLMIVAGLSMHREKRYVNCALAFGPDGSVVDIYEKQRLFGYARETEIYSAGAEPCVVKLGPLSVGLFVCFDLRFPELFRQVGPRVDAMILIANWPSTRHRHWEVLTQARAIENQCYFVGVNRIGDANGLRYTGGSVIFDPWGERCDVAVAESSLRVGKLSASEVAKVRRSFPLPAPGSD